MAEGLLPKNAFKIRQSKLPTVPGMPGVPANATRHVAKRIGDATGKAVGAARNIGPPRNDGLIPNRSDSVADNLTGLLDSNSPLVKQARTRTKQDFNRRGLANSSMAVEAGEVAAIKTALPIAQQDAAQAHESGLLSKDARLKLRAQTQAEGATSGLLDKDLAGKLTSQTQAEGSKAALLDADIEGQLKSQTQAETSRSGLLDKQLTGDLTAQTQKEGAISDLADKQIAGNTALRELDIESQQAIATLNVDSHDRQQVGNTASVLLNNLSAARSAIHANENMPPEARDAALADIAVRERASLDLIEQLYEVDIDWPEVGGAPNPNGGADPDTPPVDDGTDFDFVPGNKTVTDPASRTQADFDRSEEILNNLQAGDVEAIADGLDNVTNTDLAEGLGLDPGALDNVDFSGITGGLDAFAETVSSVTGFDVTGQEVAVAAVGAIGGSVVGGFASAIADAVSGHTGKATGKAVAVALAAVVGLGPLGIAVAAFLGGKAGGTFDEPAESNEPDENDPEDMGQNGEPDVSPQDNITDPNGIGFLSELDIEQGITDEDNNGEADDPGDTSGDGDAADTDDADTDEGNDPSEDSDPDDDEDDEDGSEDAGGDDGSDGW